MSLLKTFVRIFVEFSKIFLGVCGTRKVYNFYKDSVNNFNNLKTDIQEQVKKFVKICALAFMNVLLLFFVTIIFSLGAINYLNDYFNSVYLGHLCVGCFILFLVLIINCFKK